MPSVESLTTFSGLFAFLGTLALLNKRWTIASTLLIIAGSAGIGIFWDRWSRDTGHHVQIQTLFTGSAPSPEQLALLATQIQGMDREDVALPNGLE